MNKEILKFIETIRDSFQGSIDVYTMGSCVKFALMLEDMFDCDVFWSDKEEHAIASYLDHTCYDINGIVENTNGYRLLEGHEKIEKSKIKFRLDLSGYECPNCDEIFAYEEILKP